MFDLDSTAAPATPAGLANPDLDVCVERRDTWSAGENAARKKLAVEVGAQEHVWRALKKWELALPIARIWKNGSTIRVWLDGAGASEAVRENVKQVASEWTKHANIRFDFVREREKGQVRVSFIRGASSSEVGTYALQVPPEKETMNLGWLSDDMLVDGVPNERFRRVVLHEFGHVLGCVHEHQNPDGGIEWSRPVVLAYYTARGWKPEEVESNIFQRFKKNGIMATQFDSKSIMLYPIPRGHANIEVSWNTALSAGDKEYIGRVYPKQKP